MGTPICRGGGPRNSKKKKKIFNAVRDFPGGSVVKDVRGVVTAAAWVAAVARVLSLAPELPHATGTATKNFF